MADQFDGVELPGFFDFDVDSLVDDSLTNTWTLFDEGNGSSVVQMQTTEKSPFHESDSGVSDVSGKSPSWEGDIPMLDEILDNPTGPFLINSTEGDDEYISQDRDLVQYLKNGMMSNQTDNVLEKTIDLQTYHRKTRSQSAAMSKEQEPRLDVGSSSRATVHGSGSVNTHHKTMTARKESHQDSASDDECESDNVDCKIASTSRRKPKGSVRVKHAGAKLPSTTSSDKCNVTSVKVLRIVKSGNDSNTEDDVVKALEERNRKNAEMARQNRLKKKAYVGNLEQEVEDSRKRIDELESALNNAEEERDAYKREVEYLKSVLANQSALAGLLKNIPNVSGVTLSSSVSRKRVAELDHCYTPVKKSVRSGRPNSSPSGVCLHVDNDSVSLEFCHRCADMARGESSS